MWQRGKAYIGKIHSKIGRREGGPRLEEISLAMLSRHTWAVFAQPSTAGPSPEETKQDEQGDLQVTAATAQQKTPGRCH